jgi:PAS domain S-box-containing protein
VDLSEHHVSQEAFDFVHSERERFIAALKASRAGTWSWNIADDVVEWDDALCDVYGLPRESAPRTSKEFFALIHPDDREAAWRAVSTCIDNGQDADYQFRAVVGTNIRWIYDRSALVRNPDGSPAYMLGACLDVTEQRRIQEERDEALRRQTLLLSELSHRVKNHLSMIMSFLHLKAARQTDPLAKEDFARAIDRISTLAHLHEQLYRAEDITAVDVQTYLGEICKHLQNSMLVETKIFIDCQLEPTVLHIDEAVPVGLIVNELVTNAIKYAFEPDKTGRIVVRFGASEGAATLEISDNGRGLDTHVPRQGVGTRLVRDLAKQIEAVYDVTSQPGKGTTYSFTIRVKRTTENDEESRSAPPR